MVAAPLGDNTRLIVVDANGQARTVFERPGVTLLGATWSPRGDALLVAATPAAGLTRIEYVPIDGGATTDLGPLSPIAWLPAAR